MTTLYIVTLQISPTEGANKDTWVNAMASSVTASEGNRDALIEMHRQADMSCGGVLDSSRPKRRVKVRTVHLVSTEHIDL